MMHLIEISRSQFRGRVDHGATEGTEKGDEGIKRFKAALDLVRTVSCPTQEIIDDGRHKTAVRFLRKKLCAFVLAWAFLVSLAVSGAEANLEAVTNSIAAAPDIEQSRDQPSSSAAKEKEKKAQPLIVQVMSLSIAILAIVMGVAFFAIWCDYRKHKDLLEVCHKERIAALEKGMEVPPFPRELIDETDTDAPSPGSTCSCRGLKGGLVWLGIGVGLAIFLSSPHQPTGISAIPIGLGLAFLAYYVIEGRKMAKEKSERR